MIDTSSLREAFRRKRYGAGDYDPDFDLFDAAADEFERLTERCAAYKGQVERGATEIERLRAALHKIAEHPDTPELIRQYAVSQQIRRKT